MVQKQRLTLAPLAPLEPCKGKERDVRPLCRADPPPHCAAVPMPAQSGGADIHHGPAHFRSLVFCPAVPIAECSSKGQGCVSSKLADPKGSLLLARAGLAGGTDAQAPTRPQHLAAAAWANQAEGHRVLPLTSSSSSPFLLDFLCHPRDERGNQNENMQHKACGPSKNHACHPAAPQTFIPW